MLEVTAPPVLLHPFLYVMYSWGRYRVLCCIHRGLPFLTETDIVPCVAGGVLEDRCLVLIIVLKEATLLV